jgi:hypothetical protein
MTMKRIFQYLATAAALFTAISAGAQVAWVTPSPTDVTGVVRVYIDLLHPDCNCPLLADWALPEPPADEPDLFIWTWQPADPAHSGGNGQWANSNPNNVMKQDPNNPAHWYKEMVPTLFYGVEPAAVYATGISFLIKRKNGSDTGQGEPKSADQNVPLVPLTCVDRVCTFPQKWWQDEYLFITYDNNQELNAALRNMGPDEARIYYRYSINGGAPVQLQGDENDPRFRLKYDGDGFFSIAMLPEEFFNVPEGSTITSLRLFITKPPLTVPPFSIWDLKAQGCE